MMTVYQIAEWDKHFENAKSRQLEKLSWVPTPNKMHGMGFSRIMAEPDGAAVYGIWHMLVCTVSQQCRRQRDGWLTENGKPDGAPLAADDLALKFRRPVDEVVRALEVLSSPRVGWILKHEEPTKCPASDTEVSGECPASSHIKNGRERIERKNPAPSGAVAEAVETKTASKTRRKAAPDTGGAVWGEWIAANQAAGRKDPSRAGRATQAAKELAALLPDVAERERILRAYIADADPWLTKQGHPLHLLPTRLDGYRNGTAGPTVADPGDPEGALVEALAGQVRAKSAGGGR